MQKIPKTFSKNFMDDPNVTAMLDRTGIPRRKAVALAPTILKKGKVNDDKTDLNNFTFSHSSIERSRREDQSVLFEQVVNDFQQLKPEFAALHWDEKMMKDVLNMLLSWFQGHHTTLRESF